jgi:hypothetical protein
MLGKYREDLVVSWTAKLGPDSERTQYFIDRAAAALEAEGIDVASRFGVEPSSQTRMISTVVPRGPSR